MLTRRDLRDRHFASPPHFSGRNENQSHHPRRRPGWRASDGDALILRIIDGGKTWAPVYRSGRKLENCWKMSWPTKHNGYATVQSYDDDPTKTQRVIVKTSDGGNSWTPMAFGRAVNKIRVVRTDKAVRAFAIGVDVYRIDLENIALKT